MEEMTMSQGKKRSSTGYSTTLEKRRWLSENTFEIQITRPPSLAFMPGQRIRLYHEDIERDYSPVSIHSDPQIVLCVRRVKGGSLTSFLDKTAIGTPLSMTGPHGYFIYRPSERKPVFVATGTGVAPFVSMARSGVKGFMLLHGVRSPEELYYMPLFQSVSDRYAPCLSQAPESVVEEHSGIQGRVTDYLERFLSPGVYDFYLCGRGEMIRDVIHIVDERFPGSLVHTEIFYG